MTSPAKLYAKLLANPAAIVSYRDFEKLLTAAGFVLRRTVGSHRQYVHPQVARPLPVQPEGKDAKRYQVREFLAMMGKHELSIDE